MPTIEEKFRSIAARGVPIERIRADFQAKYGIPTSAVRGSTDWDTFREVAASGALPTLAAAHAAAGPLGTAVLRDALASAAPAAAEVAPPPVGLPSAGDPEGEADNIHRVGGLTDPASSAKAAAGAAYGLLRSLPLPTLGAGGSPHVPPQALDPQAAWAGVLEFGKRVAKARGQIAEARRADLAEKSFGRRVLEDAGNIVLGLPNMAAAALGSFEVPAGSNPYEVGFRAAEKMTPMFAGALAEGASAPLDTARQAPLSALLVAVPVARAASKLGGATATGQAAGRFLSSARGQIAEALAARPEWLKRKGLTKQTFFDLFDAGDPEVNALLEDLYQNIPEKVAAAERVVPELQAGAEATQRAKDIAPPGVTIGAGRAARAAEAKLAEKTGVPMRPTTGVQQFGLGDEPPRELPPIAQAAAEKGVAPVSLMAGRATEAGDIASTEARRAIRAGREQQQAALASQFAAEDAKKFQGWFAGGSEEAPSLLPVEGDILAIRTRIKKQKLDNPYFKPSRREQYLADMEPIRIGNQQFLASPQVKIAHEWSTGIKAARSHSDNIVARIGQYIGQYAKQVALPMAPKAIINNLVGNEFLTATANGTAPLQAGVSGTKQAIQYDRYFKQPSAARKANPNKFFDAIDETGLIGSDVIEQDLKNINLLQKNPLANLGGKAMQVGDHVYKLEVAKGAWDQAQKILGMLQPGESMTIRTSPRIAHVISKDEFGNYLAKRARSKKAPVRLTGQEVDRLVARHGSWKAKSLFFDYGGDLPVWTRALRQAPVISAVSPFTTWAFRALDVPGFKPGLGSAVFAGGPAAGISTTSKAGAVRLAAADARTALGRAALLSAMPNQTDDERTLRDAFAYIPGQDRSKVISVLTDPGATATANFSSADWLGPTLSLWSGVVTALDRTITGTDDMLVEYAKAAERGAAPGDEEKFAREQRKRLEALIQRARSQDATTAALGASGLAGSILFDFYSKMLESERAGEDFNWYEASTSIFIPRAGVALYEYARESLNKEPKDRLIGAPQDPKSRDSKHQWMMSQVFGLGWRTIDSTRMAERYANSVASELQAQADLWKKKKLADVAEMADTGMAQERRNEILQEYERIVAAIEHVRAEALGRYEAAYGRLLDRRRGD